MSENQSRKDLLRRLLNPVIKGKFTNALLQALAAGDEMNEAQILAVKEQLFIATASEKYLDRLVATLGLVRPPLVGISDDVFRELAIKQTNSKLVTNIFLDILETFYGADTVRANVLSGASEPFNLEDGDDLIVLADGNPIPLKIEFKTEDFTNINAATALEVANTISRTAFNYDYTLTADSYLDTDSGQNFVQVMSGVKGPKSSLTVIGGKAQNILKFPELKSTSQLAGTQFTHSFAGPYIRFTWSAGPNPGLGFVSPGDYVTMYSTSVLPVNRGSFTIENVSNGSIGNAYFEVSNPEFDPSQPPITLASASDLLFFRPKRNVIQQLSRYASIYEVNPYEIIAFLPVTTRIVRRELKGSAHLHVSSASNDGFLGPYIYSPKSGISISKTSSLLSEDIYRGELKPVMFIDDAQQFPDGEGFIVFDFGTDNQEGPVRYYSRLSDGSLQIDASYRFQKTHYSGSDVTLVSSTKPYKPTLNGEDYPFYLTSTVQGRVEADSLVRKLAAAGITVVTILVYPSGPGLHSLEDVYHEDFT